MSNKPYNNAGSLRLFHINLIEECNLFGSPQ